MEAELLREAEIGAVIVRLEKITKAFPGVLANDGIELEIRKGEVHALLGENGAGKTTLMNILYGLYLPDSGRIYIAGSEAKIRSPNDAIRYGIGMVHQHFMLVPTLTVVENVLLGVRRAGEFFFNKQDTRRRILEISERYGLKVDPDAKIWQISVGEQQRVEIVKALYLGGQLLILDEPTSVVTPHEVKELFEVLRLMVKSGTSLVFITHKLDEVMAISDRVTVLRKGKVVATTPTAKTNTSELANLMVGRAVLFKIPRPKVTIGRPVLEVKDLHALNDRGLLALRDVSFEVHEGEIFGIAGVAGNGQTELVDAIYGLRKPLRGRVTIDGRDMTGRPVRDIISMGVGHIPEDRFGVGLIHDFTVAENAVLLDHVKAPFSKGIRLNHQEVHRYAEKLVSEYEVKTPGTDVPTSHLSGGNLQKLILAREISREPKVLLAVQPTRGLDVGATEYVRIKLLQNKERGRGVLLISEDLDELLSLSDRVAVIFEGQIMGIVKPEETSLEEIGLMMGGTNRS